MNLCKRQKVAQFAFFLAFLGVAALAFSDGPNVSLPFADDFESYSVGTPLTDGLNGWYASDPQVRVTDTYYSTNVPGQKKAAVIPEVEALTNRFESLSVTSIWVTMDVRPVLYHG
ncbi:MAG: hypothetical protein GX811_12165, partial [Lentisphaerae bacterium]|nr:hypothetical protein [Lentisphaerota bacterium]